MAFPAFAIRAAQTAAKYAAQAQAGAQAGVRAGASAASKTRAADVARGAATRAGDAARAGAKRFGEMPRVRSAEAAVGRGANQVRNSRVGRAVGAMDDRIMASRAQAQNGVLNPRSEDVANLATVAGASAAGTLGLETIGDDVAALFREDDQGAEFLIDADRLPPQHLQTISRFSSGVEIDDENQVVRVGADDPQSARRIARLLQDAGVKVQQT